MGAPFIVGANFPWRHCGWDFGLPPHGWARPRNDFGDVERELVALRALGITVVRFWVLAGGLNYPVGRSIRELAELRRDLLGRGSFRLKPGKSLPVLPGSFLTDFAALCQAATNAGVRLLPSLLSFEWFDHQTDFDSGGRSELVFGAPDDDYRASIARFLGAALEPLLEVSAAQRAALFAWEVVNEPDWIVRGGSYNPGVARLVQPWHMDGLIYEALQRIERAGFVTTVGFKHGNAAWVQPYLWDVLQRAAARGSYLHQLHHYPTLIGDRTLGPASQAPLGPVLLGEFPSSDQVSLTNARWGDARACERDAARYLGCRLALARDRGYAGALLWSVKASDPRTLWGARQAAQVRAFTAEAGLPVA